MNPILQDFSVHYQARIEQQLSALLARMPEHDTTLIEAMRYSLLNGGKRMRPLLCYAAAQAVGNINSATDAFAASIECMHVYSLIHDDLPAMDDDDLRRGKATSHIAFNEATAILAGDALQCLAFGSVGNADIGAEQKVEALQILALRAGAAGMVMGQAIDLGAVDRTLDLPQLEIMHRHKTGALIEAAVSMGALSAGASSEQINALSSYAKALGLAFQVQDDILDVTSDTATLGKTQGADIERNKPTYVSLLGLEGAKQKAESLRNHAVSVAQPFGERGSILVALANYIIERIH